MNKFVIGIDFGTDSVRSLLVDASDGTEINESVSSYPRWKNGCFCDTSKSQFRHHPLDYIESLEKCLLLLVKDIPSNVRKNIKGISVATTGSTPAPVNEKGEPLALMSVFSEEPDAMFILWKDHTAICEANEINKLALSWEIDFTRNLGGIYSSEWFWSKILHITRKNPKVAKRAVSWVELSDWIPALLTGVRHYSDIKRNRCAAGHKAMWHEAFGGLPSEKFILKLDKRLEGIRARLYNNTYTANLPAGNLSKEWATKLDLSTNILVGVGAIDAHFGAVGANIKPYTMVKVVGTSTCDMVVLPDSIISTPVLERNQIYRDISTGDVALPNKRIEEKLVKGISGQVHGSILPDMLGLEAGQSAFGDLFDWFAELLSYGKEVTLSSQEVLKSKMLDQLNEEAWKLPVSKVDLIALDWINGRRTPDVNSQMNSWISGIRLGTTAPEIFKALVEATAFGSRAILDRFEHEGVPIHEVIATGGISKKSPFVMQTLANILKRPIKIIKSNQSGAIGAAMFAAVVSGMYKNISEAQKKMFAGFEKEYLPDSEKVKIYNHLYGRYIRLGELQERNWDFK